MFRGNKMREHRPLSPQHSVLSTNPRFRRGLSYAPVIAYLLGFVVLLLLLIHFFLNPAYDAAKNAPPEGLRKLKAVGMIMLMLTLVYLLIGLILTFRIGRFFFPRPPTPRVRTPHVDIWAEAGKRLQEKPPEE
jgi:hypothetical protein